MRLSRVRLTQLGAVLGLVVIALLAWFFLLSPRLSKATEITSQAEQLQTANLSLLNQYNQALDQAERAPEAAAEAQALFAKMPNNAQLPVVIEQITTAATDAGIPPNQVSTVNTGIPEAITPKGTDPTASETTTGVQLATMEIGVTAEGTRPQVLQFLDNLQGLDRALLVTANNLAVVPEAPGTPTAGQDLETMQVSGPMFVLRSKLPDLVAEVERLIAEAEQKQSTP